VAACRATTRTPDSVMLVPCSVTVPESGAPPMGGAADAISTLAVIWSPGLNQHRGRDVGSRGVVVVLGAVPAGGVEEHEQVAAGSHVGEVEPVEAVVRHDLRRPRRRVQRHRPRGVGEVPAVVLVGDRAQDPLAGPQRDGPDPFPGSPTAFSRTVPVTPLSRTWREAG